MHSAVLWLFLRRGTEFLPGRLKPGFPEIETDGFLHNISLVPSLALCVPIELARSLFRQTYGPHGSHSAPPLLQYTTGALLSSRSSALGDYGRFLLLGIVRSAMLESQA